MQLLDCLVGVCKPTHATHNSEDIVVNSIDANLGGACARNSSVRENKLKRSVINAREVAAAARLVLLRAEGKRVHIDSGVR